MKSSSLRAPTTGMGLLLVPVALFFAYQVWADLSQEGEARVVAAPEQSAGEMGVGSNGTPP